MVFQPGADGAFVQQAVGLRAREHRPGRVVGRTDHDEPRARRERRDQRVEVRQAGGRVTRPDVCPRPELEEIVVQLLRGGLREPLEDEIGRPVLEPERGPERLGVEPLDQSSILGAVEVRIVHDRDPQALGGSFQDQLARIVMVDRRRLQQRIGIMVGSLAAVGMRVLFALVVTWLMGIPMLKIVGGLLLFWIGWKLLAGDEAEGEGHVADAGSLWGALRTIMVADAVMSLDNVIAVAAAAKGSAFLLALGLLIRDEVVVPGMLAVLQRAAMILAAVLAIEDRPPRLDDGDPEAGLEFGEALDEHGGGDAAADDAHEHLQRHLIRVGLAWPPGDPPAFEQFADAVGAHMGSFSPFTAMILLVLVFYFTHYLFASITAHVTALLPVMLKVLGLMVALWVVLASW